MALIVQKYGGTSVANAERIRHVAGRALAAQARGDEVVVVVSAMAGETNRLLELTRWFSTRAGDREQAVVVASGEQVSAGLLALAIQERGGKARSFLAHQVRIVTDSAFSMARIKSVDAGAIREALGAGEIAVVSGFQGQDERGNVTTLGRGGSDTTAVAIAAALGATTCETYTDVDGVYTTDPGICSAARKIDRITYEEMLELASLGAKVLQTRAVELAMKYGVELWVKSSFTHTSGTLICAEDCRMMEDVLISGIAFERDAARVTLRRVPDKPGVASRIFGVLAEQGIVVDIIVQTTPVDGVADLSFTVGKGDLMRARELVEQLAGELGAGPIDADEEIAKVSIVGVAMRTHAGVAAKMFELLAAEGINIQMITTSEIKVSCVIEERYLELAVRRLHTGFGLDAATSAPVRG